MPSPSGGGENKMAATISGSWVNLASPIVSAAYVEDQPNPEPGAFDREATQESNRWDEILGDLRRLVELEDDWDGMGADKPDPATVNFSIDLAKLLRRNGIPSASLVSATVEG